MVPGDPLYKEYDEVLTALWKGWEKLPDYSDAKKSHEAIKSLIKIYKQALRKINR